MTHPISWWNKLRLHTELNKLSAPSHIFSAVRLWQHDYLYGLLSAESPLSKIGNTACVFLQNDSCNHFTLFCHTNMLPSLVSAGSVEASHFTVSLQYLVFDTQLILGGKHRKYEVSAEEYVFAALNLYLDVVSLFLLLLQLIGLCRWHGFMLHGRQSWRNTAAQKSLCSSVKLLSSWIKIYIFILKIHNHCSNVFVQLFTFFRFSIWV